MLSNAPCPDCEDGKVCCSAPGCFLGRVEICSTDGDECRCSREHPLKDCEACVRGYVDCATCDGTGEAPAEAA